MEPSPKLIVGIFVSLIIVPILTRILYSVIGAANKDNQKRTLVGIAYLNGIAAEVTISPASIAVIELAQFDGLSLVPWIGFSVPATVGIFMAVLTVVEIGIGALTMLNGIGIIGFALFLFAFVAGMMFVYDIVASMLFVFVVLMMNDLTPSRRIYMSGR